MLEQFLDFVATVGLAIWSVLTLDTSISGWFREHPLNTEMAMTIAALAGASTLLGDSVVLFLNQVRGWRFTVSLVLNGLGFLLLYALQALVIALVGPLLTGHTPGFGTVLRGVLLSTAPMVFGFLVLIPYFGPVIARLLQAWGVVILWMVNLALFGGPVSALLIVGIAWGVMQMLSWSLSRPVNWIGDRIWRMVTGQPSMMTGSDLLSGHLFMPIDYHQREPGGGR